MLGLGLELGLGLGLPSLVISCCEHRQVRACDCGRSKAPRSGSVLRGLVGHGIDLRLERWICQAGQMIRALRLVVQSHGIARAGKGRTTILTLEV